MAAIGARGQRCIHPSFLVLPFSSAAAAYTTTHSPTAFTTTAMGRAVTVRDIKPQDFIVAYAAHLKTKDNFEVPKWADIVKTGRHKVRRAASAWSVGGGRTWKGRKGCAAAAMRPFPAVWCAWARRTTSLWKPSFLSELAPTQLPTPLPPHPTGTGPI